MPFPACSRSTRHQRHLTRRQAGRRRHRRHRRDPRRRGRGWMLTHREPPSGRSSSSVMRVVTGTCPSQRAPTVGEPQSSTTWFRATWFRTARFRTARFRTARFRTAWFRTASSQTPPCASSTFPSRQSSDVPISPWTVRCSHCTASSGTPPVGDAPRVRAQRPAFRSSVVPSPPRGLFRGPSKVQHGAGGDPSLRKQAARSAWRVAGARNCSNRSVQRSTTSRRSLLLASRARRRPPVEPASPRRAALALVRLRRST